jgi:hypothetical protein
VTDECTDRIPGSGHVEDHDGSAPNPCRPRFSRHHITCLDAALSSVRFAPEKKNRPKNHSVADAAGKPIEMVE